MPNKDQEPVRYAELSNAVLFKAVAASFKEEFMAGYRVTDVVPLPHRERAEIGREDWVVRMSRDFHAALRPEPTYDFLYLTADDAAKLLAGLEKLPADERGIGTGGIYDRLKAKFPQL